MNESSRWRVVAALLFSLLANPFSAAFNPTRATRPRIWVILTAAWDVARLALHDALDRRQMTPAVGRTAGR
jgi:hypothetical protein